MMQSIISVPTSNFLKRCCRISYVLRSQSTELLNSSQEDKAESDGRRKGGSYHEAAVDIITTVNDNQSPVTVDRRSKFAFYLPNRVKETLRVDGFKMNKFPTQRKLPVVHLPVDLRTAMDVTLEGSVASNLQMEARSLTHKIIDRRVPMERREWDEKVAFLYKGLINKETVNPEHPNVLEVDRERLLQDREKALRRRILTELGNYKPPLDYTSESGCKLYMYSRMSAEFASLVKAFSQLRATLPNFVPSTLLDFGSGVGSVTWAMDRVWPRQCRQTVSIDSSAEMNVLNERLLRGGTDDGPLKLRRQHTYFRQFLPASASVKHNLVVMSRTMLDLPNSEVRLRTLDILWRTVAPGGCLMLVEDGYPQACQLMLEARHFLLETENTDTTNAAKIVAPCPHQFACPLLKKNKKYRICTDSTRYYPYSNVGQAFKTTFSYMVFHKPTAEELSLDVDTQVQDVWPRIVQPVIKKSTMVTVRLCNKFGDLQELAVVKSKHGSLCRRLAKASNLGDLFPVELLHPSEHVVPKVKIFDKIMRGNQALSEANCDPAPEDDFGKTFQFEGNEKP